MIVSPLASYIDKSYLKDNISFYRFKLLKNNPAKKRKNISRVYQTTYKITKADTMYYNTNMP